MAENLDDRKFTTQYVYSMFSPKIQKEYEKIAKKKGYEGEVRHPIIKVSDGDKNIYFDWVMDGFSIRSNSIFFVEKDEDIGEFTLSQVLKV